MSIGSVLATATSALQRETRRFGASAEKVAGSFDEQQGIRETGGGASGSDTAMYGRGGVLLDGGGSSTSGSNTDLVDETVSQLISLHAFKANVAVLRTADEMFGEMLKIKA